MITAAGALCLLCPPLGSFPVMRLLNFFSVLFCCSTIFPQPPRTFDLFLCHLGSALQA